MHEWKCEAVVQARLRCQREANSVFTPFLWARNLDVGRKIRSVGARLAASSSAATDPKPSRVEPMNAIAMMLIGIVINNSRQVVPHPLNETGGESSGLRPSTQQE